MCPACRGCLAATDGEGHLCPYCGRAFPEVAGLPDLRLESDRYLDLESERAKAERLCAIEPTTDVMGLSAAYYAMCDDIADRCGRFLRHIADAEARGEALAERLPSTGRILEVGCGTGGLLVAAARKGRVIEGVDIASRWLIAARRRLSDHGLSVPLLAASAERLPWADGRFEAVVADSVLEHLDDPARALREWARVLRPGGRLIVWSPNRYTLTTDPHVGLWGLGWLPRRVGARLSPAPRAGGLAPADALGAEARAAGARAGWARSRSRRRPSPTAGRGPARPFNGWPSVPMRRPGGSRRRAACSGRSARSGSCKRSRRGDACRRENHGELGVP